MTIITFIVLAAIYFLFGVGPLIYILVSVLLGWLFCNIDPEECYSWYSGIWHGLFFIPNLIRHIFKHSILYKADCCSMAYNVFFWLFGIFNILSILFGGRRRHY